MKVNLDKRIVCMLFLYLHFFVAFLNAQDKQSYSYASLNSTIISAEYLDLENKILMTKIFKILFLKIVFYTQVSEELTYLIPNL